MAPKPLVDDDVSDKRLIIYPAYVNSLKTVAEGRRIPRDKGCPDPHVVELRDAAVHLGLQCEPEDKAYPRDWLSRGRLRVALFDEEGALGGGKPVPLNPEITTRRELLLRLADLARRHPNQVAKAALRAKREASTSSSSSQQLKQQQQQKDMGAKRKRGTVKASLVPILEDIVQAQAQMSSSNPLGGGEAGPSGAGGGEGGGGAGGAGGGGGGAKKSGKKSAKKK